MTAAPPALVELRPNPHWARLPLFDRKGWKTAGPGEMANVGEVTRERAQSFLTDDHIERFVQAYEKCKDELGLARVATLEEIRAKDGNLSIPLYLGAETVADRRGGAEGATNLPTALAEWLGSSQTVRRALAEILKY